MQGYVSHLVLRWIHFQYINKEKKTSQPRWTPLGGATVVRYGQYLRMRGRRGSPMPIYGAFPVSDKLYFSEFLRQVRTCLVAWFCPHHTANVPSILSNLWGREWYCYQVDKETSSVQDILLFNDVFKLRMILAGRPPTPAFRVQTVLRSIFNKIHFCLQNLPSRSIIVVMDQFNRDSFLVFEVMNLMPVRRSELRIPARHDIFLFPQKRRDQLWISPSPLLNGYRGLRPRK
jgi:hypothetical protein